MSAKTKDLPLSRDLDAEASSLGCVFINPKALTSCGDAFARPTTPMSPTGSFSVLCVRLWTAAMCPSW